MCIYCQTNNYRKIYESHNGPIPKESNGRTYDIHHLDGNHSNNSDDNLKAVTIQEHYDIHYSQGDWYACILLGNKMKMSPAELSRLNTLQNLKRVADGTHPFLKRPDGTSLQTDRVKIGTHPWSGPSNNNKRVAEGTNPFSGMENTRKQLAAGKHPSQKSWKCEYCDTEGHHSGNYTRWHGVNCKAKSTYLF